MGKISKISFFLTIILISFFSIIPKAQADACSSHKDINSCEAEKSAYCIWAEEEIVGKDNVGCYEGREPTSSSLKCSAIKSMLNCTVRTDCTPYNNRCITMKEAEGLLNLMNGGDFIKKNKEPFKCSDVKYFTKLWMFIRIISPFIVILFGSLDFFKSMVAGDEKGMKASRGKFVKRIIAFFLLIILPFVIQFIFSTIGTYGSQNVCMVKCIVTNNTTAKGCE